MKKKDFPPLYSMQKIRWPPISPSSTNKTLGMRNWPSFFNNGSREGFGWKSPRFLKGKHLPEVSNRTRTITGNSPFSEDRKYSTSTHSWWTFQWSYYFLGVENIPADDDCNHSEWEHPRFLSLSFDHSKISSKNVCLISPKNPDPSKVNIFFRTKKHPCVIQVQPLHWRGPMISLTTSTQRRVR